MCDNYCEFSKLMSELSATEPKLRQITQTQGLIIQDIMQKPIPCTINLLLYYTFFKSIWPFWVNLTLRTARVWEHFEGLIIKPVRQLTGEDNYNNEPTSSYKISEQPHATVKQSCSLTRQTIVFFRHCLSMQELYTKSSIGGVRKSSHESLYNMLSVKINQSWIWKHTLLNLAH